MDFNGAGDDSCEYHSGVEMKCKCGRKITRSKNGITYKTCGVCREKKAREIRRKYDIAVVYVKELGPSPIRWDGGYKIKENKCQVGRDGKRKKRVERT
jgi:hypothetical protein